MRLRAKVSDLVPRTLRINLGIVYYFVVLLRSKSAGLVALAKDLCPPVAQLADKVDLISCANTYDL